MLFFRLLFLGLFWSLTVQALPDSCHGDHVSVIVQDDVEAEAAWNSTLAKNNVEAYLRFIAKFPEGKWRKKAEKRIRKLKPKGFKRDYKIIVEEMEMKASYQSYECTKTMFEAVPKEIETIAERREGAKLERREEQVLVKEGAFKKRVQEVIFEATTRQIVIDESSGEKRTFTTQTVLMPEKLMRDIEIPFEYRTVIIQHVIEDGPADAKLLPAEVKKYKVEMLVQEPRCKEVMIPAEIEKLARIVRK